MSKTSLKVESLKHLLQESKTWLQEADKQQIINF